MYHRGSGMKIGDWVLLRRCQLLLTIVSPDPLEQ